MASTFLRLSAYLANIIIPSLLFFFMASLTPSYAGEVVSVLGSRIGGDSEQTRFVIELDQQVSFNVFALADPYRVVIDLPKAEFHLPSGTGRSGRGLILEYRYGLLDIDKSRIVLDVRHPVLIKRSFLLPAEKGRPVRLVVDLEATDRGTFQHRNVKPMHAVPSLRSAQPTDMSRSRIPETRSGDIPELRFNKAEKPNLLPIIVIDPGHGGIDSGAVAVNGAQEKDLVLSFSRQLARTLEQTGKYGIIMTRNRDIFLSLSSRIEIAKNAHADVFISVHADKFHIKDVHGATIYTLSDKASDAESAALAQKENKADIIAGLDLTEEPDEVSDILIDLVWRETKNFSVHLAKTMVQSWRVEEVTLNKNPHRYAGFRVLTAPGVPSVLLELGYLSNARDVRDLSSRSWRDSATRATGKAVRDYFSSHFALSME